MLSAFLVPALRGMRRACVFISRADPTKHLGFMSVFLQDSVF